MLVLVPVWRLLTVEATPMAREAVRLTDTYAMLLARGTVAVLAIAAVAGLVVRSARFERPLGKWWEAVCSWSTVRYAVVLAALSAVLTAGIAFYVWEGKPALVDALAHFVHARYLAQGLAAGPPGFPYEFWVVANTFVTENGWVSQYPPGHTAVIAAAMRVGAPWAASPMLMGVTALFTTLTADRLFPEDRGAARLGALLFAVSPFLTTIAAAHLSHVTAAALLSVGAYCALRARDAGWGWAVAAGVAVGAVFAARPLTAFTIGAVVTVGTWLTRLPSDQGVLRYLTSRTLGACLGALPFVLAVAAYNAHFFGSPTRFGYVAYLGPGHELGFHLQPHGAPFGPVEGLAYTSSDLVALGVFLFRTPISVLVVVGAFLLTAHRLSAGVRLVVAWALALVVAYAFYWHHDLVLGPRLLSDAAPAWCLLAAVAGLGLVRAIPEGRLLGHRFSPRVFAASAFLVSLVVGVGFLTPRAIGEYGSAFARQMSPVPRNAPMLVFVHDSWNDRIAARLVASGMRGDSVTLALQQNTSCRMEEFAQAYAREAADTTDPLPALAVAPGSSDGSRPTRLESGIVVRARPGEPLTPACLEQAGSDRLGTLQLMPFLWQGDLPGLGGEAPMYLRDLGPVANAAAIGRFPNRRPVMLFLDPADRSPRTVPYGVGMETLWGDVPR